MISAKQKKHISHIAYHIFESKKYIPNSQVSLASILYTQGLFTLVVGAA
jgi:hypothetical protein